MLSRVPDLQQPEFSINCQECEIVIRSPAIIPYPQNALTIRFKRKSSRKFHIGIIALVVREYQRKRSLTGVDLAGHQDDINLLSLAPLLDNSKTAITNPPATIRGFWGNLHLNPRTFKLSLRTQPDHAVPQNVADDFCRLFKSSGDQSFEKLKIRLDMESMKKLGIEIGHFKIPEFDEFLRNTRTELEHRKVQIPSESPRLMTLEKNVLSEEAPQDSPSNRALWKTLAQQSPFLEIVGDFGAVMIDEWKPTKPREIKLLYDRDKTWIYDEHSMPDAIKPIYQQWSQEKRRRHQELVKESDRRRARLLSADYDDETGSIKIRLSHIKYLFYEAVHAELNRKRYRHIREEIFENTVQFLENGQSPVLPSHFALHLGVLTRDNKLLFRKRTKAALFRNFWEIGIGEFFNGPKIRRYRHCKPKDQPNMVEFARQSVNEELGYNKAAPEDFTFFGIGVEYRSLAPKLLGVYASKLTSKQLLKTSKMATDGRRYSHFCEATPKGLANALSSGNFTKLTPLSFLAAWAAITLKKTGLITDESELLRQFERQFKRKK